MTMAHPLTLPTLAGLVMIGGAAGAFLGKSAVAEINPAYFGQPEQTFHAQLAPYRSPDWAQVGTAEMAAEAEAPIVSCVGCRTWPQEYRPVPDRAFADRRADGREDGWSASASYPAPEPEPAATAVTAAENPEWQRVQVYASAPVTADEKADAARAPAGQPAAQPVAD
jgi:hypothetical protein